ncbi:MAG: (Fe-S)-binding protein [Chloroflexi bacterium]|nr:(Fe-S)-binding protein [Chloroflexota bacterium]
MTIGSTVARTAQLFVTCIIDTLYPETGEAVVRVLQRSGVTVDFPRNQTCCGQPAFNAGMRPQARQMAENTIRILENCPGDIVIPSGSCTGMIRHGYQELFADDPDWLERSQAIANRTYEFTQYLVDVIGVENLDAKFPHKISYHASCHLLRELEIDEQPQRLLENVKEAELIALPKREECCGFGGLFSIEHPEISKAMLDRKIDHLIASGASILVSCDAGCVAHISGGLQRRESSLQAVHIADILEKQ